MAYIYDPKSGLVSLLDGQDENWFAKHYRGEAGFELSLGVQATFIPTDKGVVPAPYAKGLTPGFHINAISTILLKGKATVNGNGTGGAEITATLEDKVFTHGFGYSQPGFGVDYKISHSKGKVIDNGVSLSILTILAVEVDFETGEVGVGVSMSAKGALILGAEGYVKQMLFF